MAKAGIDNMSLLIWMLVSSNCWQVNNLLLPESHKLFLCRWSWWLWLCTQHDFSFSHVLYDYIQQASVIYMTQNITLIMVTCVMSLQLQTLSVSDLGVRFNSTLSFMDHINDKVNKAYGILGITKRNIIHLDMNSFVLLYRNYWKKSY